MPQRSQQAQFLRPKSAELLLPAVERPFAVAEPATHLVTSSPPSTWCRTGFMRLLAPSSGFLGPIRVGLIRKSRMLCFTSRRDRSRILEKRGVSPPPSDREGSGCATCRNCVMNECVVTTTCSPRDRSRSGTKVPGQTPKTVRTYRASALCWPVSKGGS